MKKRLGRFRLRDDPGQAMTEFAMGVPILLLLLIASAYFAVAFNNELTLTSATNTGAQALSISRGSTSDPCATTSAAVINAAPGLTSSSLTFSIAFGTGTSTISYGTPFTGTSCSSATADLVSGDTAKVTVTYPCNLTVMGYNFAPSGCTLSAQTAELIQ
jgi:Flp pilus assembly protein TadG